MSSSDHFTPDPDWEALAATLGYPCPKSAGLPSSEPIEPFHIDVAEARAGQALTDAEWTSSHPLEAVGYVARLTTIKARDGTNISVKISYPGPDRLRENGLTALPVLFVTHGGGWMQGSHLSEEAWLLWHLYKRMEIVTVSVEYRLAPEHKFPTWIHDSWDFLESLFSPEWTIDLGVKLDLEKVVLAGSSSGAAISAVLSQMCRDRGIPIAGVVLNVPVTCDYRHFPTEYSAKNHVNSYVECVDTYSSGAMIGVWNVVCPSTTAGSDPGMSPLLGDVAGLPRHLIFVAGQDALRDEGIAYANKLEASGVLVELSIFKGLPHNFAQYPDLKATTKFRDNLEATLRQWFDG